MTVHADAVAWALEYQAKATEATPPTEAVDQGLDRLSDLLALPSVGLSVIGARLIGDGGDAAAYLDLSNGSELVFKSMREMVQPSRLMAEVVATTGALLKLKQPQSMEVVALVRQVARHIRTMGEADEAIEWGVGFLQAATVIDFDVTDQGERWGAFSRLATIDPRVTHRLNGVSVAAASTTLRHLDGSTLVRTDWFRAYVRSIEPRVSPAQVAIQMQRVGWVRRGREGRWLARQPLGPGQHNWAFWLVPKHWEVRGEPARAVTADEKDPRARTRAHAYEPESAVTGAVTGETPPVREEGREERLVDVLGSEEAVVDAVVDAFDAVEIDAVEIEEVER